VSPAPVKSLQKTVFIQIIGRFSTYASSKQVVRFKRAKRFIIVEQTTMFQTVKRVHRTEVTAFALRCNEDILLRQKHFIFCSSMFLLRNHFYFVDLCLFLFLLYIICVPVFLTRNVLRVLLSPSAVYSTVSIKVSIKNLN
jgi:hypothetical protein